MDVKATLVDKVSKSGNAYQAVEIHLTDTYVKTVFLDKAELELIKVAKKDDTNNFFGKK